jgi:steroid delta-isomerase-like uncharacterized protein
MTMIDEEWARRWCAAMSGGDTQKALTFYCDDVEFEDVPFGVSATGEGFLPVMEHFVGSGNNSFAFVRFSGGSEGAAVESVWRAAHQQDFLGVPAAGKQTEVRLVTILGFDSAGRINRHCDYWDARTVLTQLEAG